MYNTVILYFYTYFPRRFCNSEPHLDDKATMRGKKKKIFRILGLMAQYLCLHNGRKNSTRIPQTCLWTPLQCYPQHFVAKKTSKCCRLPEKTDLKKIRRKKKKSMIQWFIPLSPVNNWNWINEVWRQTITPTSKYWLS